MSSGTRSWERAPDESRDEFIARVTAEAGTNARGVTALFVDAYRPAGASA